MRTGLLVSSSIKIQESFRQKGCARHEHQGRVELGLRSTKAVASVCRASQLLSHRCEGVERLTTTWAYVVLMGHRNEITGYLISKTEDARLDRRTSVGYAKQVLGRSGTKGAITILCRCKKCGLLPKDDVMWCLNEEEGACDISQSPQEVLLCILRCSF